MNAAVAPTPVRPPWLDQLVAEPATAVDSLLCGWAHLPGLQRASPSEALLALCGDLPPEAPEWPLLDDALLQWLQGRRENADELLNRPGGAERFIRETGEGIRAAWRLNLPETCLLPRCAAWLRQDLVDLLRWADGFSRNATFDLGRPLLTAAAHLQEDQKLRFLWLRICDDAARPRWRHRLDAALLGLASMPGSSPGSSHGGPSSDLIIGLARWAGAMPQHDSDKSEVVREWRALKAAFPRQPAFWRAQWQAILDDKRHAPHPFTGWLREADPALQSTSKAGPRRAPQLPKDIKGQIAGMEKNYRQEGLTPRLWLAMSALLNQLETYADATDESYYLVTSCTNIATIIMAQSPGQALTLARRALLWAPSNGHAWSVRATALDRLGRPDLAEAVLWEAQRRIPSDPAFYLELARLWQERGGPTEAEALLRKALTFAPNNAPAHSELARLLWLGERSEQALTLLQEYLMRRDQEKSARYTLAYLLVAEGQPEKAAKALAQYRLSFGDIHKINTLQHLLDTGPVGREEARQHLRQPRQRDQATTPAAMQAGEAGASEQALAAEQAGFGRLQKISRVAQADFQFRRGAADQALPLVDAAIAADASDAYAQVVKGLAQPDYRCAMRGRLGSFHNSLPVNLAFSPEDAPADHWQELLRRFPEGRYLTHLQLLSRNPDDDTSRSQLAAWCDQPTHWGNAWESYLKETLKAALDEHSAGEGEPLDLRSLTHDALTQAVDVGLDAAPLAA